MNQWLLTGLSCDNVLHPDDEGSDLMNVDCPTTVYFLLTTLSSTESEKDQLDIKAHNQN